jgi:cytochrome c553
MEWKLYLIGENHPFAAGERLLMKSLPIITMAMLLLVQSIVLRADEKVTAKYQPCIACHGDEGQGNVTLGAPALAGQGAAYLERQLMNFKTGIRGNAPGDSQGAQMKAMADTLEIEDIAPMANYLSNLPIATPQITSTGDLKNGNNFYHAKCGACHGGQAEGNPGLNAPGLAWLDAAYLKQQYLNFQQGVRGSHPHDIYGRQMKMMSTSLPSDSDLEDVIAFMQSLAVTQ